MAISARDDGRRQGETFNHSTTRRRGRRAIDRTSAAENQRRVMALHQFVRRELLDARDAVTLLREELMSVGRSYAEPAYALQSSRFAYAATIRRELTAAEERLAAIRNQRQEVVRELRRVRDAAAAAAARASAGSGSGDHSS